MSSYFRPNYRRRVTPVNPSPFRMAPPASSYKRPIPRTQFVVYDQPRPSHTYHTQQSPLIPPYFDVDQSVDNLGPQEQFRTVSDPVFQQSASVNPYNQTQTPVQIQSRRYCYEDAPIVPFAGEPSYIITNPSQEAGNPTTVRIIRADGSSVEEIAEPQQDCGVGRCCIVSGPIDYGFQEQLGRRKRSPSRGPPPLRVRRPYQSPPPEEQSRDEELDDETAGVAGSVVEEGFGLSKEQTLAELELLVTIMRQLLVEYRDLEAGDFEEESELQDGLGEDDDAGENVEGRD